MHRIVSFGTIVYLRPALCLSRTVFDVRHAWLWCTMTCSAKYYYYVHAECCRGPRGIAVGEGVLGGLSDEPAEYRVAQQQQHGMTPSPTQLTPRHFFTEIFSGPIVLPIVEVIRNASSFAG